MLEVVRIVADWLGDTTNGVNALLPALVYDMDDVAPPDVVRIEDETRDGEAAIGQLAEVAPLLVVMSFGGPVEAGPTQGVVRYGTVNLLVRYQAVESDTAKAERDSQYTMRAVARSLLRLMKPDNHASRVRGTIGVEYFTAMEFSRVKVTMEDQIGTTGLTFSARWRDTSPEG